MNITIVGIFVEGLLSFLSPCVLPLLPLYMSYLAGEDKQTDENGNVKYKTGKVFITTVFFVLGICFTLTLLALSVNIISSFLSKYSEIISIICGTILILFGLHEIGLIHINILDSDTRFKVNLDLSKMNFLKAFLLGFIFSLGWSPCIGPMLANALMMVASEQAGYLYIIAYGLGLTIPFLLTGLLTSTILNFVNSKKQIMKYVMVVAGVIMLCFGAYMIYNGSKDITTLKTRIDDPVEYVMNYSFEDQHGKKVKLSDYKNKYVILNFVTSWCTYCKQEIPEYSTYSKQAGDDVVCLYVMSPIESNTSKEALLEYIDENIEIRTIIDEDNTLTYMFGISSYPSMCIISPKGNIYQPITGLLNTETLNQIIEMAKANNQ